MPDEDPRQIEQLLRAAASARGGEAPRDPAMPGPMREALQREVSRAFQPLAKERPAGGWLTAMWPRFALAAAVLIAAGVAIFHDRAPTGSGLAQQQIAPQRSNAPAPDLETAESKIAMDESASQAAAQAELSKDGYSDAAAAEARSGESPAANLPEAAATPSSAFGSLAEAPAAAAQELAGESERLVLRQRFSQQVTAGSSSGRAARALEFDVLQDFTVARTGQQLKITDADGSVYLGDLAEESADADAFSARPFDKRDRLERFKSVAVAGAKREDNVLADDAFQFRATGVSRGLNKPVVIEGTYLPGVPPTADGPAPAAAPAVRAGVDLPAVQTGRIRARAQISGSREVAIDALAVEPAKTAEP